MKLVGIYKITNKITGKSYIGQSEDIIGRWKTHSTKLALNNDHYRVNFVEEYNKYGITAFTFEVLEIMDEAITIKEREELESKYILKYNTIEEGYNLLLPEDARVKYAKLRSNTKPKSEKTKQKSETNNKPNIISKTPITTCSDTPSIREFTLYLTSTDCKLNCKYQDMFQALRDNNYFYYTDDKQNMPKEEYLNTYFQITHCIDKNYKPFITIHLTEQGKEFLKQFLLEHNLIKPREENKAI